MRLTCPWLGQRVPPGGDRETSRGGRDITEPRKRVNRDPEQTGTEQLEILLANGEARTGMVVYKQLVVAASPHIAKQLVCELQTGLMNLCAVFLER